MILTRRVANQVAAGRVDLVFRRWRTARIGPGHRFHSTAGDIVVDSLDMIDPDSITDADAHAAGAGSREEILSSFHGSAADPVFRIGLSWAGPDPRVALAAQTTLTPDDHATIADALRRLDDRSSTGPWTTRLLHLIHESPGIRAAELATRFPKEKDTLKRDVRKLKNLGLTHSLATGYRLSARGSAYLFPDRP